ncbi:MAG: septum formation initiator family protein [Velocimicrobium sp.]
MAMRRNKRVNKKRRANLGAVAFVVLLLCCVVAYKKIDLDIQETECQNKLAQLDETKVAEEKRSDEIEDYKVYVQSKQYIEQEARDKLGLTYPDEIVFEADDN